jgi:replication factor C subunit 2/4
VYFFYFTRDVVLAALEDTLSLSNHFYLHSLPNAAMVSTVSALQARLKELSTSVAQIHPLVSRLHNFTTVVGQGDDARLELGAVIHSRLKDAEDELELIKDDVDDLESTTDSRRRGAGFEKETEKERVIALARRLANDLKRLGNLRDNAILLWAFVDTLLRTRGDFRNAQLQAKRNAELAKRKERELLFARSEGGTEKRNPAKEKLTQEDIVKNASKDVTAALRRTHQLMQAELSRSQFAQETLGMLFHLASQVSD